MPILRRSVVQFCSAPLVRFHTALDTPQTFANLRPADPRDAGKPVQTSLLASGEGPSETPAAPGEPGVGEDSGVSGVISESDPWDEEKEND